MNFEEYKEFTKHGFESYDADCLNKLFFDYLNKHNIDTVTILSMYPKNFFNDGRPELYVSISDHILIMTYIRTDKDKSANTIDIRIVKKSCIKDVEFVAKSDRHIREINSYKQSQLDVTFGNGDPLFLSSLADSNENWAYRYTDMILHFMANI